MATKHDAARDHIADCYHILPALDCYLCGRSASLPNAQRVVEEWRGEGYRADIAALGVDGRPLAIIEVIDSHPPAAKALAAQRAIPLAFYVETDALAGAGFAGWCSVDCWQMQNEMNEMARKSRSIGESAEWTRWRSEGRRSLNVNFVPIEICVGCEESGRRTEFWPASRRLRDWDGDPYSAYCLPCAADVGVAQWQSPGEQATGAVMELPEIPGDAWDIFMAWSGAAFWAMVWRKRFEKPEPPRREPGDESATAARLDEVESAFDSGDWSIGARLLYPVGSTWLQDRDNPPLWAWRPENCKRVASAWARLRGYLLNSLPDDIAARADKARTAREKMELSNV